MAVMTDVREAAQNLIEYAIHRSMIGQDDRIWAYNTILECIGATGPALDMAWALQPKNSRSCTPTPCPTLTLKAHLPRLPRRLLPTAPRGHGIGPRPHRHAHHGRAHAKAFGCKRGVQRTHGRQRAPRRDRLVLRPVLRRRLRAPCRHRAQHQMEHPHQLGRPRDYHQPVKARKGPGAILPRPGAAKNTARSIPPASSASKTKAIPDAPLQPTAAPIPPARICALSPLSSTASAGASNTARTRTLTSTALP